MTRALRRRGLAVLEQPAKPFFRLNFCPTAWHLKIFWLSKLRTSSNQHFHKSTHYGRTTTVKMYAQSPMVPQLPIVANTYQADPQGRPQEDPRVPLPWYAFTNSMKNIRRDRQRLHKPFKKERLTHGHHRGRSYRKEGVRRPAWRDRNPQPLRKYFHSLLVLSTRALHAVLLHSARQRLTFLASRSSRPANL